MFNVRRIIKLIPIIWGFFIFNCYSQKIYYTTITINKFINVEIKLRMVDVLDRIQIEDLNNKKIHNILCHENDYYLGIDGDSILFHKRITKLNELKEKGGKLNFNIKVFSKTGKSLYIRKFNPSAERVKKVILIRFI
jgi:hypothetical protein